MYLYVWTFLIFRTLNLNAFNYEPRKLFIFIFFKHKYFDEQLLKNQLKAQNIVNVAKNPNYQNYNRIFVVNEIMKSS